MRFFLFMIFYNKFFSQRIQIISCYWSNTIFSLFPSLTILICINHNKFVKKFMPLHFWYKGNSFLIWIPIRKSNGSFIYKSKWCDYSLYRLKVFLLKRKGCLDMNTNPWIKWEFYFYICTNQNDVTIDWWSFSLKRKGCLDMNTNPWSKWELHIEIKMMWIYRFMTNQWVIWTMWLLFFFLFSVLFLFFLVCHFVWLIIPIHTETEKWVFYW